jgi:hypothetical protein
VKRVTSYTVNPTQSITIKASWPGNYVWSNSASSNSVTVSSPSNTTFWVKDNYNCFADTFKLKVLPAVNFTNSGSYCAGQNIQFTDNSTNNPINWQWTVSPNIGVTINNQTSQNPQVSFGTSSTYTINLVSGNAYGQGIVATQTLLIHPKPFILYLNNAINLCLGETTTLTATGSPNYLWSNGQNSPNIVVSPTVTTIYTTTFISSFNCVDTGSIVVNVDNCTNLNTEIKTNIASLFPNPTSNILYVELNQKGNCKLQLIDVLGKPLLNFNLSFGKNTLPLDILRAAIFIGYSTKQKFWVQGNYWLNKIYY